MSFFDTWPLWVWLLTTFGIIGTVALIFLAPVLAVTIGKAILKLLETAIRTPLGAGIIVGAIMFGIGWYMASERAIETCNARIEQMKVDARNAAAEADKTAAQNASQFDSTAQGWIESTATKREEIVHAQPKPVAAADCRKLGSAGLKWLRDIAPD